jgi:hypothetical protein
MDFIAHVHCLLLNDCTRSEKDEACSFVQRGRYVNRLADILAASRLERRTEEQIWKLGWDKPFFAYNRASNVGPLIEQARAAGVFADRTAVASDQFMRGQERGPLVRNAIQSGHLKGTCAVTHRLARVQSYALAVPQITEAVNRFHNDWLSGDVRADELQERAVAIAEDIAVGGGPIRKVAGFGFTTACHLLADLGLPLFKPDIWVCRMVSSLPGVRAEIRRAWRLADDASLPFDFLESKLAGTRAPDAYRRIVQPVMNALVREVQAHNVAAADFDLTPAFLRHRFVDWTLVHFAISAEAEVSGLERRPIDVLRAGDPPSVPAPVTALARWLEAGQASHEAVMSLKNAEAKVRRAESREERERAHQRLLHLRAVEAQARRDELAARSHAAWTAYEAACAAVGWRVDPRYPEGFARREPAGAWTYKRAARERAAQLQTAEPASAKSALA